MICIIEDGKSKRENVTSKTGTFQHFLYTRDCPQCFAYFNSFYSHDSIKLLCVIIYFHKFVPMGKLRLREIL